MDLEEVARNVQKRKAELGFNRIIERNIASGYFNRSESSMLSQEPPSFGDEFQAYANDYNRGIEAEGGLKGQNIDWLYQMLYRNQAMNDTMLSMHSDALPQNYYDSEGVKKKKVYSVTEVKKRLRETRVMIQKNIAAQTGYIPVPEVIDLTL